MEPRVLPTWSLWQHSFGKLLAEAHACLEGAARLALKPVKCNGTKAVKQMKYAKCATNASIDNVEAADSLEQNTLGPSHDSWEAEPRDHPHNNCQGLTAHGCVLVQHSWTLLMTVGGIPGKQMVASTLGPLPQNMKTGVSQRIGGSIHPAKGTL